MSQSKTNHPNSPTIFRILIRAIIAIVVLCAMLFGSAGRLEYWQGWAVFVITLVYMLAMMVLYRDRSDLAEERLKPGPGTKWWDRVFYAFYLPLAYGSIILGALDSGRWGWTGPLSVWVYVFGYLLYIVSLVLFFWAMRTNNFFSSTVRIQSDRGQYVVQNGPYAYIRHPGYVGAILMIFGVVLGLGSLYALIPATGVMVVLIVRTALEDRTLQHELSGYKEYSEKVRYRLLWGVW